MSLDIAGLIAKIMEPLVAQAGNEFGVQDLSNLLSVVQAVHPKAAMMRQGVLFAAVGELERHINRLNVIQYDFFSQPSSRRKDPRDDRSGVHALVEGLSDQLGERFDRAGGLTTKVIEIVERRNALVHRDGRVDQKYVERTKCSSEEFGALLEPDASDLSEAIGVLEGFCWRSTFLGWSQWLEPRPDGRVGIFRGCVMDMYAREDWLPLGIVSDVADCLIDDDEEVGRHQLNRYLAARRLGLDDDQVRKQMKDWRLPHGTARDLIEAALFDDVTTAIHLLPIALENGDTTTQDILQDKVFDHLGNEPQFRKMLEQ